MKRRLIATLLAVVMAISVSCVSIFAAGTAPSRTAKWATEAVTENLNQVAKDAGMQIRQAQTTSNKKTSSSTKTKMKTETIDANNGDKVVIKVQQPASSKKKTTSSSKKSSSKSTKSKNYKKSNFGTKIYKQYFKNYLSMGDSVESGWGLPKYNEYSKKYDKYVITNHIIPASSPWRVARSAGCTNLWQYHMPGCRTNELRYELDNSYRADWVTVGQMTTLSEGSISKPVLDAFRPKYQAAAKKADVINVDIGLNDCWVPVMSAVYDIADYGRLVGDNMTIPERVKKYGSMEAIVDNVCSYIRAWVRHPALWALFVATLMDGFRKWFTDYYINLAAIVSSVYRLNPKATLIISGMYNPINDWDLFFWPVELDDDILDTWMQPYYSWLNVEKKLLASTYPGKALYVDMKGVDIVTDHPVLTTFESMGLSTDPSKGYNPHPTIQGTKQQAGRILRALGIPTNYPT